VLQLQRVGIPEAKRRTSSYRKPEMAMHKFSLLLTPILTNTHQENVSGGMGEFHPFRNDDRLSEEGWAAKTTIHKDVLIEKMETNLSLRTMPFGMRADRWPGAGDENSAKIRASAAKHGIKFDTSYAVPMSVSIVEIPS
jgi:hypothetical protein